MILAVVSDTHRRKSQIGKVLKKIKNADVLIHLGDNAEDVDEMGLYFSNPIYSVRGNCDFSLRAPSERIETIGGKRILITHGHKYSVKYNLMNLKYRALEVGADIVLYGHTHIANIECNNGIWFINPGSASISRGMFNSIAFIEINNGVITPSIVDVE